MAALLTPKKYQIKPLKQHLECLREHRAICQAHIESISADISLGQKDEPLLRRELLAPLHRTRLLFRQQAKTCSDAICPISWIPNEILTAIFAFCLPPDHRFSPAMAPFILIPVCQLWRDTAISTRSFWSSLAFWTPASKFDRTCYPLRLLGGWFGRSGRSPLDIFLEQGLKCHHMKFVVEAVLLAHYPQCRHLDIHVTSDSAPALNNFVILPPGSLMSLESLVLEGLDEAYFPAEHDGPIVTAFRNSPRLQKLTTNALDFAFIYDPITFMAEFDDLFLPWPQLTHLMITDFITADVFVVVLTQCTGLQFLRVSLNLGDTDIRLDMDYWLPDHQVALANLTEMHLSVSDGFCIPSIMDALTFPALQNLHFRRSESEDFTTSDPFSWEHSRRFLRQLCGLRHLSLVGRVGTAEEVLVLLQSTPQVTHLKLDIWTDYQFLIPAIFPPTPLSPDVLIGKPLHALTHLALHLAKGELPFPSHCIRDAVDSPRCVFPLTDLTIIVHRGWRRHMKEIRSVFSHSPLQTCIGMPAGPIGRSARFRTDERLIDCARTNRYYTMIDPLAKLVNRI